MTPIIYFVPFINFQSIIDVSFDFFDPNPNVDYQAIKRLLVQLFHRDAEALHVDELTELILGQPTVGTTVKTDGIESDPLALLTVLNMHLHHVRFFMFLHRLLMFQFVLGK